MNAISTDLRATKGAVPASKSIVHTTLLLLPAQLTLRAGEAAMPMFIAYLFGRTSDTDLYFVAAAEFGLVGALLFDVYRDSALVPLLTQLSQSQATPTGDKGHAETVASVVSSLAGYTLVLGGALSVIAAFALWLSLKVAVPNASAGLPVTLCLTMSFQLVVMSLRSLYTATLNAQGRYLAAAVPGSLGVLVCFAITGLGFRAGWGIKGLAYGMLLGELAALGPSLWNARQLLGQRLQLTLRRPLVVRLFARRVLSEVMGGAVVRVNPLVDQLMVGAAGVVGGGSLLRFGADVALAPTSLLQAAFFPVLLTELARRRSVNSDVHWRTVRAALVTVGCFLGLATLGMWVARRPLLGLLFGAGAMDPEGLQHLSSVFRFQILGLVPFGLLLVLARTHISLGNSRIMFGMGLLNVGLNVVFNLSLLPLLGIEGVALSTSLVQAVVAVAMALHLRRFYAAGKAS